MPGEEPAKPKIKAMIIQIRPIPGPIPKCLPRLKRTENLLKSIYPEVTIESSAR